MSAEFHLSDESILRALDRELDPAEAACAESHMARCGACGERREELQAALAGFSKLHAAATLPPAGGAAERLRVMLSAEQSRHAPQLRFRTAIAACVALVASTVMFRLWEPRASAAYLPDRRLTPGATQPVSREQLCVAPETSASGISDETALRVFDQYRIREPRAGAYEVDYLITPALGGSADIRNLWPQPYTQGEWNARVKDALEDYLRAEVCGGRMDLATAQHEIASNWVAAYRKYFSTERPLAVHAMFVKDGPWHGPSAR